MVLCMESLEMCVPDASNACFSSSIFYEPKLHTEQPLRSASRDCEENGNNRKIRKSSGAKKACLMQVIWLGVRSLQSEVSRESSAQKMNMQCLKLTDSFVIFAKMKRTAKMTTMT